jgi:mycothiol synthase
MIMNEQIILPAGFALRPAAWTDLEPATQLILEVCTADGDPTVAVPSSELKLEWQTPGFTLEKDAWVVTSPDNRVVGYEEFVNRHAHASMQGDGYVHPTFQGLGIGTALLHALDERAEAEMALAEPDLRVFLRNGLSIGDTIGRQLHENEGYKAIRFSWRMEITLEAAPPAPQFPAGIELRPFLPAEHDHAIFEAEEESFRDHWGHTPTPYESWKHRKIGRENFDPALWFVAWEGNQIAGFSQCRYRSEMGWVSTLGVRRPWRKHGLGLALLLHSFGEFYRRGQKTIGLGVDAQNPTGATRLYLNAGMHVASEYVIYEKEFRPGREPEE